MGYAGKRSIGENNCMIKLIKSTFYNEKKTKNSLIKFLKNTQQLSFGPECEKFEKKFAKFQKRKYCVFVNSGSSANLALIQALLNLGRIKKRRRCRIFRNYLVNKCTAVNSTGA